MTSFDAIPAPSLRYEGRKRIVGARQTDVPFRPIWLEVPDTGVQGWASVVSVKSAPPESMSHGCLVLMTVNHIGAEVMRVRFSETAEMLELTPVHRLYVEGRGWTQAQELSIGDRLRADHGPLTVASLERATPNQAVFNLEVAREHTYRVLESRVWTHNAACADAAEGAGGGIRTEARNLAEQSALDEAKAGAGKRIMEGKIKDPKYPEDAWAKMSHVHELPGGGRIEIHYWENLKTGVREGFKFK